MKTAKLLALCLCLPLCLAACTQAGPSESSSESSSVSSSSESQSKEEPYKITLTDELVRANNANARNGGYIMEEERYIVYRNPADGGKLYRYEKETGEAKILYNTTATNGFLHSIEFFDNRIYFVTRAVTDEVPTLYSVDIEGENLERVIENVGDDYIVTSDTIYYTSYRESNGAYFYMYKYDRKTGKSELMRNLQSEYLNLVGDEIYFVDYTFTGESLTSGSGAICKINVKTNKVEAIPMIDEQGRDIYRIGRMAYFNEKLFFTAHITGPTEDSTIPSFYTYDLSKQKIERIITEFDLLKEASNQESGSWYFIIKGTDDYFFYIGNSNSYTVFSWKNGKTTVLFNGDKGNQKYLKSMILLTMEGNPVTYGVTNEPDDKIIGGEKLLVKAGEA